MTDEELGRELDQRIGELGLSRRRVGLTSSPTFRALFAIGHARLGKSARARALAAAARQAHDALEPLGHESVTWVFAALLARVEQAIAGAPRDAGFPEPIERRFATMSPPERDEVVRVRAVSRMLEPIPYTAGAAPPTGTAAPPATLEAIEAALDATPGERGLVDALTALLRFGESAAMPLVARAVAQLARDPAPQLAARATALRVAARFGWGELVHGLVPPILEQLVERPHAPDVWFAMSTTICALRRLGDAEQLRRVIDRSTRRLGGGVTDASLHVAVLLDRELERREELRFVLAGAATTLGDSAAVDVLQRAARIRTTSSAANLALHRRLCQAYAHGVPVQAIRGLRTLVADFAAAAARSRTLGLLELIDLVDAQVWAITMLG